MLHPLQGLQHSESGSIEVDMRATIVKELAWGYVDDSSVQTTCVAILKLFKETGIVYW